MLKHTTWEPVTYTGDGFTLEMEIKRLNFLEGKAFEVAMGKTKRERLRRLAVVAMTEAQERQRQLLARINAALAAAGVATVDEGTDLDAAVKAAHVATQVAGVSVPELTADELDALLRASEGRITERQEAMAEFLGNLDDAFLQRVFGSYVRAVRGLEVDGVPVTDGPGLLQVADYAVVMFVLQAVEGFASLSSAAKKASSSPHTSGPVATDAGASPVTSAAPGDGMAPATATDASSAPSSSV